MLDLWFYATSRRVVRYIRALVSEMVEDMGVDQDTAYDVETIIEEALGNAIEHAYPGGYGPVRVILERDEKGDEIAITVRDWGAPMDVRVEELSPDVERWLREGRERGMGLAFIKALSDKMEIRNLPDGKEIRILKKVK